MAFKAPPKTKEETSFVNSCARKRVNTHKIYIIIKHDSSDIVNNCDANKLNFFNTAKSFP